MVKPAYYNEFDTYAAAWIRNLIARGMIAPGDVDERDIRDVHPDDLRGYSQVHLFAGIGVWSYALRRAGWPDDRQIWTASCPCQPFSAAGAGAAFADERHLWPHVHYLIQKRNPAIVVGEQVASKDADEWLDLVQDDMEALGAAFGAIAFPSAGVGAPHIRDRTYWVGDSRGTGLEGHTWYDRAAGWQGAARPAPPAGVPHGLANDDIHRRLAASFTELYDAQPDAEPRGDAVGLGYADSGGSRRDPGTVPCSEGGAGGGLRRLADGLEPAGAGSRPGATNGFWADVDWLLCRDGKWRPVESGTFPLADGSTNRVGRVRAYGNAINAEAAEAFISCLI